MPDVKNTVFRIDEAFAERPLYAKPLRENGKPVCADDGSTIFLLRQVQVSEKLTRYDVSVMRYSVTGKELAAIQSTGDLGKYYENCNTISAGNHSRALAFRKAEAYEALEFGRGWETITLGNNGTSVFTAPASQQEAPHGAQIESFADAFKKAQACEVKGLRPGWRKVELGEESTSTVAAPIPPRKTSKVFQIESFRPRRGSVEAKRNEYQ